MWKQNYGYGQYQKERKKKKMGWVSSDIVSQGMASFSNLCDSFSFPVLAPSYCYAFL
jgi:hypothetical protein